MSSQRLIFISYRREDSADVTGRIYDRLVDAFGKQAIFKDVDNIPIGIDFRKHLDSELSQCKVLLVVIGPEWVRIKDRNGNRSLDGKTDFVRIEIEAAIKKNIQIVPILVRNSSMPTDFQLPKSIESLAFRQGIHVRRDPDFHKDMDRLIEGIKSLLKMKLNTYEGSTLNNDFSNLPSFYTNLKEYLANGQWKKADDETLKLMLALVGKEKKGYLQHEDITNFPCHDLLLIDQLWTHYSSGQFGFSIQHKIYSELGNPIDGEAHEKELSNFLECIEWMKIIDDYIEWIEPKFSISACSGHLPYRIFKACLDQNFVVRNGGNAITSLTLRLTQCDFIKSKPLNIIDKFIDLPSLYITLKDYLAHGLWEEADRETFRVMLEIVGQQERGYLDANDIARFPCKELNLIDQLWIRYSDGRFGFSIQKAIYFRTGNPSSSKYLKKAFSDFRERVEWIDKDTWISGQSFHIIYDITAPRGHLPATKSYHRMEALKYDPNTLEIQECSLGEFYSRVDSCGL